MSHLVKPKAKSCPIQRRPRARPIVAVAGNRRFAVGITVPATNARAFGVGLALGIGVGGYAAYRYLKQRR